MIAVCNLLDALEEWSETGNEADPDHEIEVEPKPELGEIDISLEQDQ